MMPAFDRPITFAMLALGGQGGGVLTRWLVDTAEASGYLAQSTYVAGVAQRTGSTVYCVEFYPITEGKRPVFTPYPVPGDVDLVVAAEMAETGRAIQKGFVTPNTTTLIASSHRIYSITEKEALDDGIVDQTPVAEIAAQIAKDFICFDMEATAQEAGSIISSVILGAIASSGALPFERATYENTIRETGRAVDANLKGFAAGFEHALRRDSAADEPITVDPEPEGSNGEALRLRIHSDFPEPVRSMAWHGALRALDYQDRIYADEYLDTVATIAAIDTQDSRQYALTNEVARQLALQMCYEDTIRVAELKTRADRIQRIRDQVAAAAEQPVRVVEYFHPRIEEICDTLPRRLGNFILTTPTLHRVVKTLFSKGRNITTSSISGFLMLHSVAGLKRWRRGTYRFTVQQALIADWLRRVREALSRDYDSALAVANSIETVKGYGDTYQRGLTRYREALQ